MSSANKKYTHHYKRHHSLASQITTGYPTNSKTVWLVSEDHDFGCTNTLVGHPDSFSLLGFESLGLGCIPPLVQYGSVTSRAALQFQGGALQFLVDLSPI
jgi:hypothetical protein